MDYYYRKTNQIRFIKLSLAGSELKIVNLRANKISLKRLALSGLLGAKWFCPHCTTGVLKYKSLNVYV